MVRRDVFKETEEYVKEILGKDYSGHDWAHISRVRQMAKRIQKLEDGDLYVIELASLLHDLDDHKITGDKSGELKLAWKWLNKYRISPETKNHICGIITTMSFKGSNIKTPMRTIEGKIVQDADYLDAMGAVGIMRAFYFAGNKHLKMDEPDIKPNLNIGEEEYKHFRRENYIQINHFHEKLLLLKDRMNTKTARKIAEGRHGFMEAFLERYYLERECED